MIIGVDPGTTTGIAIWDEVQRTFTTQSETSAEAAVSLLWLLIDDAKEHDMPLTIVCERYDITSGTVRVARNRDPYHVEGALRFRCELRLVSFHQESRANAMRFAHDERLKRLDCYATGREHARDATRQVITYLAGTSPEFRRWLTEVEREHGES